MPKISVITPCYNGSKYLAQTVDSIRQQTLADFEYIVVDDGSTDDSAEIAARYASIDPRIQVIRKPNGGLATARNSGYLASSKSSEYLLFIDADDCLEPSALEVMTKYLDAHPEVGTAYCPVTFIDGSGRIKGPDEILDWSVVRYIPGRFGRIRRLLDSEPETPLKSIIGYFMIAPSACFMRRSVFDRTTLWDEDPNHYGAEDADMAIQMALLAPVHFVPQRLARYREHGANMSTDPRVFRVGLRHVQKKWWCGRQLTHEQKRAVREALLFNSLLSARFEFEGALKEISANRSGVEVTRKIFRGSRHVVKYAAGFVEDRGQRLIARATS